MKPSVNWSSVLVDMKTKKVTQASVAAKVGLSPSAVMLIKKHGREPSYRKGEAIIDLWIASTGKSYEELPRVAR